MLTLARYYMSTLMKSQGFNDLDANYMSLVGGGALLIGTIPAIFLMETCGRRFWANATLPCFFVGLVLVGVSYHLGTGTPAALGVYFTGLIIYEVFFGSYACLTWVSIHELQCHPFFTDTASSGHPSRSLPNLPPLLRHDDL